MSASEVAQMSMDEFNHWIAFHKIENDKSPPSAPTPTSRSSKGKEWTEERTPATFEKDVSTAMKKRGIGLQSGYNF